MPDTLQSRCRGEKYYLTRAYQFLLGNANLEGVEVRAGFRVVCRGYVRVGDFGVIYIAKPVVVLQRLRE